MAEYTIELKDIVENHNIFDFAYPFYDESKRHDFERSFIRHFYFREIGCETIDRFKHYLNDKMNVVFPYYNELFKSASIEYDVLDNYKLTETYERKIENNGKTSGISSTVGQTFDKQESEANQNKTVDNIGNVETSGNDTTNTTGNKNTEGQNVKKFLDTPQGLTDLSNSKYLTNLTQDNSSGQEQTNGQSETNTMSNTETTGKETTVDKVETTSNQELKTTNDNNTRTFSEGEQSESYTLTRRGNIGVDTDSEAIEKHNRLHKTLKNIERMFFEECEDLFMLVY